MDATEEAEYRCLHGNVRKVNFHLGGIPTQLNSLYVEVSVDFEAKIIL